MKDFKTGEQIKFVSDDEKKMLTGIFGICAVGCVFASMIVMEYNKERASNMTAKVDVIETVPNAEIMDVKDVALLEAPAL